VFDDHEYLEYTLCVNGTRMWSYGWLPALWRKVPTRL